MGKSHVWISIANFTKLDSVQWGLTTDLGILMYTLYFLHFAFYCLFFCLVFILLFTIDCLHCIFYILHFPFYCLHCLDYILLFGVYIVFLHFTFYFSLFTMSCLHFTVWCLHRIFYIFTFYFSLFTLSCLHFTAWCLHCIVYISRPRGRSWRHRAWWPSSSFSKSVEKKSFLGSSLAVGTIVLIACSLFHVSIQQLTIVLFYWSIDFCQLTAVLFHWLMQFCQLTMFVFYFSKSVEKKEFWRLPISCGHNVLIACFLFQYNTWQLFCFIGKFFSVSSQRSYFIGWCNSISWQ